MLEEKEQTVDRKKIILISAVGVATLMVGGLIWYFISSSQFALYTDDTYPIHIKYPKSWQVAKGYAGTVVTFVSPKEDELDGFQENLNVAVTDLSQNPMSLAEYTQLAIKQMAAVFQKNFEVEKSEDITYAGVPAHVYVIRAPNPQDLIFKFIWFIKDGQAYTITYAAQMIRYETQYLQKFNVMLDSFSFLAD